MDKFQELAQDFKDAINSVQMKFSSVEEEDNERVVSTSVTPIVQRKVIPVAPPPPPIAPPGSPEEVDVLVVGGGLSGLTAAYHLSKHNKNLSVVVLEAKERLGGRVWTQQMKSAKGNDFWDLGRTWINSKQVRINSLIEELEIDVYEPPKSGQHIMDIDGKTYHFENSSWPLPFFSRFDLSSFTSKVENMRNVVPSDDPTKCQHAWEWDKITLEQFRGDELYTSAAVNAVDTLIMLEFGVTSREISLLYFLHYLNGCGGWSYLIGEKEGRSREVRIMGGSQTLCEVLANKIKRRNVKMREQVVEIDQRGKKTAIVTTKSGAEYSAKRVIIAISSHSIDRIEFLPILPATKSTLLQRMPSGTMYKAIITYAEPFWQKQGYSGQIIRISNIENLHRKKTNSYFHVVYDATTWNNNPALEIYYTGLLTPNEMPEDRQGGILSGLNKYFNCADALDPLDFMEVDWSEEAFCSGYPTAYLMPGCLTYYYGALREPLNRVHWAGSELASTWKGHMEGSVESGSRAAVEVLSNLYEKNNGTAVANGPP